MNDYILIKKQLPEPEVDVTLLTDQYDTYKGHYSDGKWWIKLPHPFVGHQNSETFDVEINITHWKPLK